MPADPAEHDLAELITAQSGRYGGELAAVEHLIHGSHDPVHIAHQLSTFVREQFGVGVRAGLFHQASAGSVTGLVLDDGRRLVIKAYQPRWKPQFLRAVVAAQHALASAGMPCAVPLIAPQPYGGTWATAESFLPDPGQPEQFGDAEMQASAQGLAALIDAAPMTQALDAHPMNTPCAGLYPTPHSPLFDFEATAAGAEWINELASLARPHLHVGLRVVAHTDWSARNVRLTPSGVQAIYDLDSLAIVSLPAALGTAAATWRSTGEPGDAPAPGVDEIDRWLSYYPHELSVHERRGVLANALSVLAYTARCEHAIDPAELQHRRARPTLRSDATAFIRRLS